MSIIDLRSDTVTRPSPAMRQAMADAEVGDEQYDDDPTVARLQERMAALLGKEASLFMPSGTMANQVALKLFTRPGDEVVGGADSHVVTSEAGGGAAHAGIQFTVVGRGGLFSRADFVAAINPATFRHTPPTTLVHVENSHNRGGGRVFPQDEAIAICREARARAIASYLDGARLFNVAAATRASPAALAEPFDALGVAMSKGLGCPIGSVLAGRKDDMIRARRYRQMVGGALRQAGILAAAGLYALDHNLDRLAEDNAHAKLIAQRLAGAPGVVLDVATVETNIVIFDLAPDRPDAAATAAAVRARGVLVNPFGPRTIRCVTHLDVGREQCLRAADILARCVENRDAA